MKILFVTAVLFPDVTGASRFANLILNSDRIDADVLTHNCSEINERIINIKVNISYFKSKLWPIFAAKLFQKKIDEIGGKYDFIIYNSALLANNSSYYNKSIVFIHDDKQTGSRYQTAFDFLRISLLRRLEEKVCAKCSLVIANSQYLKSELVGSYNLDKSNVEVIYQGITLSDKTKDYIHKPINSSLVKIIFVKNNHIRGGLRYLLDSLLLINNYQFEVTVIGPLHPDVEKMMDSYNSITTVFLSSLTNHEVIKRLYESDVLCIPAKSEALGVAIMEGLAVGIPTVTTNVGGLKEVTNNGAYVWQCEPENAQSIATAILNCLGNLKLRSEKSKGGKIYTHDKFNFDLLLDRLLGRLKNELAISPTKQSSNIEPKS